LTIAYEDVVRGRISSKVLQPEVIHALPVHSGTEFIAENVLNARWHAALQARDVENSLTTTVENPLSDVSSSFREFEELCLAAVQNGPSRIRQPWREGVAKAVGRPQHGPRIYKAGDSVRSHVTHPTLKR
jgi:hypothetical protein